MSLTQEQLERLPKWAQNEIVRLESNLAGVERQLACALGTQASRVRIAEYGRPEYFLPDHTIIEFGLLTGNRINVHLDNHGQLNVSGYDCRIRVAPRAANVVHIEGERD